jgi:hypothetical protein
LIVDTVCQEDDGFPPGIILQYLVCLGQGVSPKW